jgi:hypothetical protein
LQAFTRQFRRYGMVSKSFNTPDQVLRFKLTPGIQQTSGEVDAHPFNSLNLSQATLQAEGTVSAVHPLDGIMDFLRII